MKTRVVTTVLSLLWISSCLFAFQTPDVVYVRVPVDRTTNLAAELVRDYTVTGGGEDYIDLVILRSELDELSSRAPSYEVIYGSQQEKIKGTVGLDFEDDFHDYDETIQFLNQTAADHPGIVRLYNLGFSVENREIRAAKVTGNPDIEETEPEFRVIGLHHGDELMSTEVSLLLLEHLTDNYGVDSTITHLVDNTEIWVIPMMNPDGRMASPYPTRYNANGVDLNRDYGYMWNGLTPGNFSQPETKAIRNHGIANTFMLSLSYHTSGDIVNYVWNYSSVPTPDDEIVSLLSEEYGSYNGYWVVHGYYWYQTYGDCNDWSYGSRSSIDWTIELANSNIQGVWDLNRDAIIALMDHTDEGIEGVVTDADTGDPLEAMITVEEIGYPWYTDPSRGDYHRLLLPGEYTVTFSAPGYADTTVTGVTVPETGTTQLDVSLRPGIGNYPSQVVSCYFFDPYGWPDQYEKNPTNANWALGWPDTVSASLGEGGNIVLDFGPGRPIPDIDGVDFTVHEEGSDDGYTVYLSNGFVGPWTWLGEGEGTQSFDIHGSGFQSARYVKIVDDDDGSPYDWYPGCDIDAVTTVELPDTVILIYGNHAASDSTYGDGDGTFDPGETIEITVTLDNIGTIDATGVTAVLSSPDTMLTFPVDEAFYPDIMAGESGETITPYVMTISPGHQTGESATLALSITCDGGLAFEDSFRIMIGTRPILLVDDDGENYQQYFTFSLDGADLAYDSWSVLSQGAPAYEDISDYRVVIWTTGQDYEGTLTATDRATLGQYLDSGGSLFLSSQDYLYENGLDAFATDYLHVSWYDNDQSVASIGGVPGDPISDGLNLNLTFPSGFTNYSDDLLPDSAAAGVFVNTGYGASGAGGETVDYYGMLRYPAEGNATFRTVFSAVPFEAIPLGGYSIMLMERITEWLMSEDVPAATLVLEPDAVAIPAGGSLGLQVTVMNQLETEEQFTFRTDITLPGGGTYPPSGSLFGPVSAWLDPLQMVSVHLSHPVPGATPRLVYTYNAYLSLGGDVVAEDHFDFEVVDPAIAK